MIEMAVHARDPDQGAMLQPTKEPVDDLRTGHAYVEALRARHF